MLGKESQARVVYFTIKRKNQKLHKMTKITEKDDVQNVNKNRYKMRFLPSPSQGEEGAYDSSHNAIEPIK